VTDSDERELAGEPHKELSRRHFLKGTAGALGAALASAGIYELIDTIAQPPERAAFAATQPWPEEQYVLENVRVIMDNGSGVNSSNGTIAVLVHPLHNHVITAKLNVQANANALQAAQHQLESVLLRLEQQFSPTPTGLSVAVAWGLPYFHHYIPSLGKTSSFFQAGTRYPAYLPVDLVTSKLEGHTVYAVQEAMTFPSDQPPAGFGPVHLEQNDVAVLLRSDSLTNVMEGMNAIFGTGSNRAGSLFTVTSIRRGFAGGGFYGRQSLPSRLALAANIPGAKSIPPHAELFLGFTSTLQSNMGPGIIANLETLPGVTDQWPHGYFRQGTTMQLSHMFQDLATWYGQGFPQYARRVQAMLQPGLSPAPGTLTLNPPGESEADVVQGVQQYHAYGHTGSMAPVDSTTSPTTSNYGVAYPTGTTIPVRGDFDTLDNPFYYTADPTANHYSSTPAAGLHFIMFQPTIAIFNRVRLAMDGHYADQTLNLAPRSPHAGINSVLFTTHRQNFLVPPRRHRSFPLAEFLA
jgi:TAT (twin-arginine translocation) pathway signal sequence